MNILILYAHPEPTSFTAALKDTALHTLRAKGHDVEVSDLYADGFSPVPGRHDFTSVADPRRFHYQSEQMHAAMTNGFAPDIAREQDRIGRADLVLALFPIWNGGLPAILKGWFDRVFAYGFAYADGMRFDKGFFLGRRSLMGIVTGGTRERFSADGVYGEIADVLFPVQRCLFGYFGFEALEPFVAYAAPRVDDGARAAYLEAWARRLSEAIDDPDWLARRGGLLDQATANRAAAPGGLAWAATR
jgi:NAD(P)H dehydrogenase (quinone)